MRNCHSTKRSANAGGVRASRQTRKMVSEKAKNSERYPRATKLLVAEFKLRRARGSKISKLWMKSKMKKKIEMCYGKEAADKFKASDNWFQRFKRSNRYILLDGLSYNTRGYFASCEQ